MGAREKRVGETGAFIFLVLKGSVKEGIFWECGYDKIDEFGGTVSYL